MKNKFPPISLLGPLIVLAMASLVGHSQTSSVKLTNDDIQEMTKAGLSADIIVAKIQTSTCSFDTSPPALRVLKSSGVPEAVILAMVKSPNQTTPKEEPAQLTPSRTTEAAKASNGTQEPLRASANVRVNVYRYKQFVGKALRPSIYCDAKDVVRLQNGRYVALALAPGKHAFRSNDKQSQIDLDLKAGQEYYIRIDIATGMWKGHGRLTLVQPEQGAGELKQMKAVDAGMINDKEFLAADFEPTK